MLLKQLALSVFQVVMAVLLSRLLMVLKVNERPARINDKNVASTVPMMYNVHGWSVKRERSRDSGFSFVPTVGFPFSVQEGENSSFAKTDTSAGVGRLNGVKITPRSGFGCLGHLRAQSSAKKSRGFGCFLRDSARCETQIDTIHTNGLSA